MDNATNLAPCTASATSFCNASGARNGGVREHDRRTRGGGLHSALLVKEGGAPARRRPAVRPAVCWVMAHRTHAKVPESLNARGSAANHLSMTALGYFRAEVLESPFAAARVVQSGRNSGRDSSGRIPRGSWRLRTTCSCDPPAPLPRSAGSEVCSYATCSVPRP